MWFMWFTTRQPAPALGFTEPTFEILCWFSRHICWFTASQAVKLVNPNL